MNMITCNKVTRRYDMNGIKVDALKDTDLTLSTGEFAALYGPSGSGKTTLLNLIGALDTPTSGSVSIGGTELAGLPPSKLADIRLNKIGFVFQAYNLIPVLSALENVEYVLLLQGTEKQERLQRAREILVELGLENEMDRRPHELSGGQQQRVAVGRAVVSRPDVVLADEPTANLDQKTGEQLLAMMERLNRERSITFLFSTHDPMVMDHAGRLIQLRDGRIVSDESAKTGA